MRTGPQSLLFCTALLLGACSDSNPTSDTAAGDTANGVASGNTGDVIDTVNSTDNATDTASDSASDTASDTASGDTTDGGATEGVEDLNNTGDSTDSTTDNSDTTANENADTGTNDGVDTTDDSETVVVPSESFADYRITFDGSWSAATHATLFPGNAHFSGLVGAVHNDQVIFWEPGQIASDGIELMAETGGKSIFLQEIESAINSGYALSAIDGPGIATAPGSASIEVRVTIDNPLVTLTTMLAPSPDWFTGFHNIRLHDGESFVQSVSIDGFVYDSGTDSGPQYTSSDSDTQPRTPIARTTTDPADSPFVDGLPIAGRFIIERL